MILTTFSIMLMNRKSSGNTVRSMNNSTVGFNGEMIVRVHYWTNDEKRVGDVPSDTWLLELALALPRTLRHSVGLSPKIDSKCFVS